MSCHVIWHDMTCQFMSCHAMSCHVMPRHGMPWPACFSCLIHSFKRLGRTPIWTKTDLNGPLLLGWFFLIQVRYAKMKPYKVVQKGYKILWFLRAHCDPLTSHSVPAITKDISCSLRPTMYMNGVQSLRCVTTFSTLTLSSNWFIVLWSFTALTTQWSL